MLRNRKGFTLVEMIVTITISVILLGMIVLGIVQYRRYAHFKRLNEYAEQLFIAAQQELTVYSQMSNLVALQDATDGNAVPLSSLQDSNGNAVTATNIWKDSDRNYQGTLCYLVVNKENYAQYLQAKQNGSLENGTAEDQLQKNSQLYDLFDSYVYNKDILAEGTICVEFDPYEGMVYAVLYSDQAEEFTYTGNTAGNTVNICNRTYDYRKSNMIGYYGVDTLSKSTSTEAQKPVIGSVKLNNEDTLNLSFNLTKITEATQLLNYEIILYSASDKTPLLSIEFNDETNKTGASSSFDKANYLLVSEDNQNTNCTIQARVYDYRKGTGSGATDAEKKEQGENYTFPAWIDATGTVHFVLDAVDLGATVMDAKAMAAGQTNDMEHTFSLHRFDIDSEDVYCTIVGQGGGYSKTSTMTSNTEHAYFGSYETSILSDDETYTLYNARHLYNLRFQEAGIGEKQSETGVQPAKNIDYAVKKDLSWADLIAAGGVYKAQDHLVDENGNKWITQGNTNNNLFTTEELKVSKTDSAENQAFPSIQTLHSTSTLQSAGNGKTYSVSGFSILKSVNESNDNQIQLENKEDATGLFLRNDGTIQNLKFDQAAVEGTENVGTVCGQNNGVLENLTMLNTDDKSKVSGTRYVGGITGNQKQTNQNVTYDKLVNRSTVTGVQYVGGIIGSLDSKTSSLKVSVTGCENYGRVHGIADPTQKLETAYIGGIVGYAYSENKTEDTVMEIKSCSSSPQYTENDILSEDQKEITVERIGKYVGGIVGYNDGASISNCNTCNEKGKVGYVIGDRFVGGIVGYNNGVAGKLDGGGDVNEAVVIGKTYVGGIVGANATMKTDSETPSETYDSEVVVQNWINHGIVVASEGYAGGISGFNAGQIVNCNSDVDYDETAQMLTSVTTETGNYVGGIAGYNNGQITAQKNTSAVAVITGQDYVGGIVGYNDVGESCKVENYELQGGYVTGRNFVGGYVGINASENLLEGDQLVANPNDVTGKYCVGGIIGGNIVAPEQDIATKYETYNILGNISGTEFVGGFIGYNLLLANRSEIGNSVRKIEEGLTENYQENIKLLEGISSDCRKVLSVNGDQVVLRQITADLYVGGVIGFNSADSYLYISNVTNRTPIHAKTAVTMDELKNGIPENYSYVGGVMGKVSQSVIIDNCSNAGVGEVHGQGTYTGGIAELNCGLIMHSNAASIGNNTTNQVGGIVGVNAPESDSSTFGENQFVQNNFQEQDCYWGANAVYLGIYDCGYSGTITGNRNVGGLVAANYGAIYKPTAYGTVTGYEQNIGGIVGYNYDTGRIMLYDTLKMKINGKASDVGGVAGNNKGTILVLNDSPATKCTTNGDSIVGTQYVGGIVGRTQTSLFGFVNATPVTASQGSVGGIAGIVTADAKCTIGECANVEKIQATLSGDAGGIAAECGASCTVENCGNGVAVVASNGFGGGITAVNEGVVTDCTVSPSVAKYPKNKENWSLLSEKRVVVTGDTVAGAVTAKNRNVIQNCQVMDVTVTNLSTSKEKSYLGGVTGTNKGKILLSDLALQDVTVSTYTDDSCVGGIVGWNLERSSITSQNSTSTVGTQDHAVYLKFADNSATKAKFGGVAGANQGEISNCQIYGDVEGGRGDSRSPTNGYGGVAGVNGAMGEIAACSFDGTVYADGNSSLIACIGGIVGLNNGRVTNSVVGITAGGNTVIQCGTSNTAYGYVGGLIGHNQGEVKDCDNKERSKATVSILNYAGHTGGLIGRNNNKAVVTGTSKEKRTTSGENWTVLMQYYDNDCGAGGIMGYSASGADIKYVENYASVYSVLPSGNNFTNISIGGMIGRLENSERTAMIIENCSNYGGIYGQKGYSAGFIGTLKFNAITFQTCKNYGKIGGTDVQYSYVQSDQFNTTKSDFKGSEGSAGMVGRFYLVGKNANADTARFMACENHGVVYTSKMSAGLVAYVESNYSDKIKLYFSDCVNTGCIYGNNAPAGIAGTIDKVADLNFYRCENYGLGSSTNFCGIYAGNKIATEMVDCLDCSNASSNPIAKTTSDNYKNNYYVCKSAGAVTTPKSVEISSGTATKTSTTTNDGIIQQGFPLSNSTDGSKKDADDARLQANVSKTVDGWLNNQVTIQYNMQPTTLTNFDICWGSPSEYRCYTYRLYYQVNKTDTWIDNGKEYQTVVASGNTENTVIPMRDTSSSIQSVKIVISEVKRSSTKLSDWNKASATPYVVIKEIYPRVSETELATIKEDASAVQATITTTTSTLGGNTYDGVPATSDTVAAVDLSSEDSMTIQYNLKEARTLTQFGILWSSEGETSRRYTYQLYYQMEGATNWQEVTGKTEGSNSISYSSGYQVTVPAADTPNEETVVKHIIKDENKIQSIKIVINKAERSTDDTAWTDVSDVILSEIYPVTNETTTTTVPADNKNVNTGIPLMTGSSAADGYTLTNEGGSEVVKLTHLACDVGAEGYQTDTSSYQTESAAYSNGSARYRVYYAVSQAYRKHLNKKYADFNGKITVGTPEDVGDYSYNLTWTSTQTPYAYEVSYQVKKMERKW